MQSSVHCSSSCFSNPSAVYLLIYSAVDTPPPLPADNQAAAAIQDGEAGCRGFHARTGIAPRNIRSHPYRGAIHRRVLRRERRQPALGGRRRAALPVQRHQPHAHLLPGRQRAAGAERHRHRAHRGRAQREARLPRLRPKRRGRLGPGQRPGLPGRLLPLHRRGERGGRRGHRQHPPRHAEHRRRPRRRRPRRRQGVHGGAERRHAGVPAVGGELLAGPHGPHRAVPAEHRRAAPRERLPLLLLHRQQGPDRHQLRALHLPRHRRAGRQQRLPEPLRRARRHLLLRARERRGRERRHRRVGERLAVGRGRRGHHGQRADLQPEPNQPCWAGHAQAPRGHRDLHIRHVQRGPEARSRDGEALRIVQPGQIAGIPHQVLSERI